jgi:UDP-N-acetylmuramate dehydrogenase
MEQFSAQRRGTQPPGASMGSMFKNPPGDFAGRLIEAAGLKGRRVGGAEISPAHANFFINDGKATAADIGALIALARSTVREKMGIQLELEVELLGDWPALTGQTKD